MPYILRAEIAGFYRYPVKGFRAEPLEGSRWPSGRPFHRRYAIENGPSGFNPSAPDGSPRANTSC